MKSIPDATHRWRFPIARPAWRSGALVVCLLCGPASVRADWMNLTGAETAPNIAEIYILEDRVKLVLEVYVGDLDAFEELVPEDWPGSPEAQSGAKRARGVEPGSAERMRRFSSETFRFVTETGEPLGARLEVAEPRLRKDRQSPFIGRIDPFTRERVRGPPEDKRVLYAEVVYPFGDRAEGRPTELTIVPPLDDEQRPLVTIGFIVYHKDAPVIDFRHLNGPSTIRLDWDDPWRSTFDAPNLRRHHKFVLSSFLYIEPLEVRHEILARVKELDSWMDLGLRGARYVEVDELEPLKRRIAEFLMTKNPVRIDGKPLKPILDRSDYIRISLKGIKFLEKPGRLEITSAIVGVIFAYITEAPPRDVTVEWELFTDGMRRIPVTSIDAIGPRPATVSPDGPVHTWTNRLKDRQAPVVERIAMSDERTGMELPVGTALCVIALVPVAWRLRERRKSARPTWGPATALVVLLGGALALFPFARVTIARPASLAAELSDEDAKELLESVLSNIYRAFDLREEEDVYDKLALTVQGDLLTEIYLQNRKSLEVENSGGARVRVKKIEILEGKVVGHTVSPLSYTIRGQWTALGTVGHWGHVHVRKNRYDALVTIQGVEGSWKIASMEILEESRVDPSAPGPASSGGSGGGASNGARDSGTTAEP